MKVEMTDEEIQVIWQTMPGGPAGWLKSFGYLQFARAIEEWMHDNHKVPNSEQYRNHLRYQFLRNPNPSFDDFPPADGACWVVKYSHTKGSIPEMRSAGFGINLDVTIDMQMAASTKDQADSKGGNDA